MVMFVGLIIIIQVANYGRVGESVAIPNLFLNPTFVIIPIIINIVFYRYLWKWQFICCDSNIYSSVEASLV